ncbi:MAG: hypothetical protein HZB51_28585 [Chloroflexi bacterium]|nr:hypothetical protein [Chloroflexota bacterium]
MNKLFGADGIRGTLERYPLRMEDVERLAQAIVAWLATAGTLSEFLVGTDTRESSQRLKAHLCNGLNRTGISVVDAGILPTPAVSYLLARKGYFSGGVMISASHNPVSENGIKVFDPHGIKISDPSEQIIEEFFFGGSVLPVKIHPAPSRYEPSLALQYANALASEVREYDWHRCRVVVDCANGAAYAIGPQILKALRAPCTLLNISPDGTNINVQAGSEVVRSYPQRLAQELVKYDAQVGLAFDGDADRVLFVDRRGRLYDGDMETAILALELKDHHRLEKDTVVATQMSNSGLAHFLGSNKIRLHTVQNGDKHITDAILTNGLTLGGEEVGHIIVHDNATRVTGDGLRAGLMILGELNQNPGSDLSDLAPGMLKWPQVNGSVCLGERTRLTTENIPGLSQLIDEARRDISELTRFECRPASTEPSYRIMLEARATPVSHLAQHALRIGQHIQKQLGYAGYPIRILDCVNGGLVKPE